MNLRFWVTHPILFIGRLREYIATKWNPDTPWLCAGTVEFCREHLSDRMQVLEYGSGRSSIWFAQRVKALTSVESRSDWFEIVSKRLRQLELKNVDYRLVPLEHPEHEAEHVECDPMAAYVRVADEFEDECLDFAIIDGHYRNHCIRRIVPKLKIGGFLLVDDVNFWGCVDQLPVPRHWKIVDDSTNGLKRALIWQAVSLGAADAKE